MHCPRQCGEGRGENQAMPQCKSTCRWVIAKKEEKEKESQRRRLRVNVADAKKELMRLHDTARGMTGNREAVEKEVKKVEAEATLKSEEMSNVGKVLNAARLERDRVREERASLALKLEKSSETLEAEIAEANKGRAKVQVLGKGVNETTMKATELLKEVDAQQAKVQKKAFELEEETAEKTNSITSLAANEDNGGSQHLEDEVTTSAESIKQLTDELEARTAKLNKLRSRKARLDRQQSDAEDKITRLEQGIKQQEEVIVKLRADNITPLEAQMYRKGAELDKKQKEVEDHSRKLAETSTERDAANGALQKLRDSLLGMKKADMEAKNEEEKQAKKLNEMEKKLKSLQLASLRETLKSAPIKNR